LRHRLPLVVEPGRTTSLLAGRYYGDHPKIAVHRKPVGRGEWTDECVAVGDDGRFRATLAWPEDRYDAEFYWFMLTGSDADCRSPGWAWSYKVRTLGSNGRSPLRGRGESGAARRN
ncbi:MAG: hypothetical protein ABEL76_10605, partial [Bradymonadaceae bacterium]